MTGLVVVAALVLLVAALLGVAEWRWARRPMVRSHLPREVWEAIHAAAVHERTRHLVQRVAVEMVEPYGLTLPHHIGETTLERAWRPWGSARYLVRLTPYSPGPVYLHELAAHVVPHASGEGWNRDHARDDLRDLQGEIARTAWPRGRPE